MPNCFCLIPKGSEQPQKLAEVDDAMRVHFGADPHPENFYERWYDTIGLALAMGHTWKRIRELYPYMLDIIDWLEANYTADAWYQHGR